MIKTKPELSYALFGKKHQRGLFKRFRIPYYIVVNKDNKYSLQVRHKQLSLLSFTDTNEGNKTVSWTDEEPATIEFLGYKGLIPFLLNRGSFHLDFQQDDEELHVKWVRPQEWFELFNMEFTNRWTMFKNKTRWILYFLLAFIPIMTIQIYPNTLTAAITSVVSVSLIILMWYKKY